MPSIKPQSNMLSKTMIAKNTLRYWSTNGVGTHFIPLSFAILHAYYSQLPLEHNEREALSLHSSLLQHALISRCAPKVWLVLFMCCFLKPIASNNYVCVGEGLVNWVEVWDNDNMWTIWGEHSANIYKRLTKWKAVTSSKNPFWVVW